MQPDAHNDAQERPVLVYDGDCGFCRWSVDYWRALTGDRVDYQPYQKVADCYPEVSTQEFARSIYLFQPDGSVSHGAEAAYRVFALAPGAARNVWLWLYQHLPGFRSASEVAYGIIARHRVAAARVSHVLWGRSLQPSSYALVSGTFLRLLALLYLAAFVSFGTQAMGLVGSRGVVPLVDVLQAAREQLGSEAYWQLPTLFWFSASDQTIQLVCMLGALASVAVALGVLQRVMLVILYLLYLTLLYGGHSFMTFQWDLLLLEVGFLAIFLPGGRPVVVWLFRWLTFRYLFLAGAAKIVSQDPTWRSLTALRYHFETQPLPTPLAWYADRLPDLALRMGTGFALVTELVLPFLIFMPRRLRFAAAWAVIIFELGILLTGNYNFFNLLTMALCLLLFDDAALKSVLPPGFRSRIPQQRPRHPGAMAAGAYAVLATVVVTTGLVQMYEQLARERAWKPLHAWFVLIEPLRIVNGYGLFANMTTTRPEIIIEGSADGEDWRAYEFRYKPGALDRPPGWNLPHQPRLDWQMWFAALGSAAENPWFGNLMLRLLEGSPEVLGLLETNPFPGAPPRYVRAELYEYRYAPPELKRQGQWWTREPLGSYFPPISLDLTQPRRVVR